MGLPSIAATGARGRRSLLGRRQAAGLLLFLATLLAGRLVRHHLLVGPDGAWRRELWLDALLEAPVPGAGDTAAAGAEAMAAGPGPAATAGPKGGASAADTVAAGTGAARPDRRSRTGGPRKGVGLAAPLDINRCSADSLQLLPGVGPVLAARLAEARRQGTVFRTPSDLLGIKGIGPAAVARLAPLVRFADTGSPAPEPDNPH